MTTKIFNIAELISWGYETGGDFDEALRVYGEFVPSVVDEVANFTETQMSIIEKKFNSEFVGC